MGIPKRRKTKVRSKKVSKRNAKVETWENSPLAKYYVKDYQKRLNTALDAYDIAVKPQPNGSTVVWTTYSRRVTWHDVKVDWGILITNLKWGAKFALSFLTTMKDFLQTKSRSYSMSSDLAPTVTSSNSSNGCTDKPVPSSNVIVEMGKVLKPRQGFTSTICSAGSVQNATAPLSSLIKKGRVKFHKYKFGKGAYGVK